MLCFMSDERNIKLNSYQRETQSWFSCRTTYRSFSYVLCAQEHAASGHHAACEHRYKDQETCCDKQNSSKFIHQAGEYCRWEICLSSL